MSGSESGEGPVERDPSWQRTRDRSVIAALVSLFVAVRLLYAVPWWLGMVLLLAGIFSIRPRLAIIGLLLLLGARSGSALSGLEAAASRPVAEASVELVSDPRQTNGGWSAQGTVGGERVMVDVQFSVAPEFGDAAVGDTLVVTGSLRGSAPQSSWAISRRIVGNLAVTEVHDHVDATGVVGAANALRGAYRSGVTHFDPGDRALFTGLVFGDDRNQHPIDADNFRASGLSHALAVSGQNVAFVLLLAAPLLGRLRHVPVRVVASLLLLVGFGFLTRFEPSVTRAIVMAGAALIAHAVGRQSNAALALPVAVALIFVFDPLFAWSLAFQLSVAATVGMVVLTPRIAALLPGPEVIRLTVAATLGAQLFVAPLLLSTFGRVSVVAVPANVLAGPAVAGVMMWGLVIGPVVAVVPGPMAVLLHLPTRIMIRWIAGVAEVFASIGVGHFGVGHLTVGAVGLGALLATQEGGRRFRAMPSAVALSVIAASVAIPILVPRPLEPGVHRLSPEVTVARSPEGYDVVVLDARVDVVDALEHLRTARLGRIDLLIASSGSRSSGVTVHVLVNRFEISTIWAPPGHSVPGALTRERFEGTIGSLRITEGPGGEVEFGSVETSSDGE